MRYTEFRDLIVNALREHPHGLTWAELRTKLDLPYDRPCPSWLNRMEMETGLSRRKGVRNSFIWQIQQNKEGV